MSGWRRGVPAWAAPGLVIVLLTAMVTWPQGFHLSTRIAAHNDALFSIWRLAWVAQGLATDPRHLFDANIFHPAANTLSFSDAMLLQGVLAAPLFWAGVSPILIYNVLLVGGIALSGFAMFVLARHVTGSHRAALVSGVIFTVAPYRIEHFMHLELQWAMWMPLAFWAIHRTFETRAWRFGLLAGLFVWLQLLSSVYYGVFLAAACVALVLLLSATRPGDALGALPTLVAGGIVAAMGAAPYAWPYLQAARTMARTPAEVAAYSATWWSYLASPPQSLLWSWTSSLGGPELRLFPGAVAILLALTAVLLRPRRIVAVYAVLALVAIDLSLGSNGYTYSWLLDRVDVLHGLRAPARFGIIACSAVAILAGFGAQAVEERLRAAGSRAAVSMAEALTILVAIDGATSGMWIMNAPYQPASVFNVYKSIRALGPGPVLELPLPRLDALPGHEATFMLWSTAHWHPLVNGYSGYYPHEYSQTVSRIERFPDDQSIAQLTNIGVRYIVVHRVYYDEQEYGALIEKMDARPELRSQGTYDDPLGECHLFVLGH